MGSSKLGKVLEGCLFGLRVYLSTLTLTLTFVFDMSRQGCKEVMLWGVVSWARCWKVVFLG